MQPTFIEKMSVSLFSLTALPLCNTQAGALSGQADDDYDDNDDDHYDRHATGY